jgi:hypothetical protein
MMIVKMGEQEWREITGRHPTHNIIITYS